MKYKIKLARTRKVYVTESATMWLEAENWHQANDLAEKLKNEVDSGLPWECEDTAEILRLGNQIVYVGQ